MKDLITELTTLQHSYRYCADLTRESGSNFYYSILLAPKHKRLAMYAIYAWMREVDDIADKPGETKVKMRQLIKFYRQTKAVLKADRAWANHAWDNKKPITEHWPAFRDAVIKFRIPLRYFRDMVHGQLQTIAEQQFNDFSELYTYCYRVASVVGLICIKIWGYEGGTATEKLAEYRGIAFQLTNVLRDVYQDAIDGRIYIPKNYFPDKIVSTNIIISNSKHVLSAVKALVNDAGNYFKKSDRLEKFISQDGQLPLMVMSQIYFNLLQKIRQRPEATLLPRKIRVKKLKKIYLCIFSNIACRFPKLRRHYY